MKARWSWVKLRREMCGIAAAVIGISLVPDVLAMPSAYQARNPGYISIAAFGAKPNDDADDTVAFRYAVQSKKSIYVPEGTYQISDSLVLFNANLRGEGSGKSIIEAHIADKSAPIIKAGRTATITGVTLKYADDLVTGMENAGERVGIYCGQTWSLQRGSLISDVVIDTVGTGVYSARNSGENAESVGCFSVTFESMRVCNFSYRGFDMQTGNRTGNVYRDIVLESAYSHVSAAFSMKGEESESVIQNMTIQNIKAATPLSLDGARAFSADSLTFNHVAVSSDNGGLLFLRNSSGVINQLQMNNCTINAGQALVSVGSNYYGNDQFATLSLLTIRKLQLDELTMADKSWFFYRSSEENDAFWVDVQEYTHTGMNALYEQFPTTDNTLFFMNKGKISQRGKTAARPKARLCAYYSRYFDEDLQRTLVWDGKEWR